MIIMWIASSLGYYSIVKKQGEYYVRVRDKQDLLNLMTASGIQKEVLEFAGTDYVARIIVNDEELRVIQNTLFNTIDYPNFKNSIMGNPAQRDKTAYYGEIWGIMWDYQYRIKEPKVKKLKGLKHLKK